MHRHCARKPQGKAIAAMAEDGPDQSFGFFHGFVSSVELSTGHWIKGHPDTGHDRKAIG